MILRGQTRQTEGVGKKRGAGCGKDAVGKTRGGFCGVKCCGALGKKRGAMKLNFYRIILQIFF